MVGLMRYQAYSMLGPAGSKTRHGSSRLTSVPAIAVLCVLAGYILGRSHVPDREPYPLDMEAFLPPPQTVAGEQQQQQQQQEAASFRVEAVANPPARGSGMGSMDAVQQHSINVALYQRLNVFGKELAQSQLLQQRPPLDPGKSGNSFYTVAPHQVLSWYPRIVLFPSFLDNATVAHIIALAKPQLQPSELGSGRSAAADQPTPENQPIRSSMGVFLNRQSDPAGVLAAVEEKISAVTFIPPSHGEEFNVLRYRHGQHYHSHMDTFDANFVRSNHPGFGQRMATMVLYLSDVEEGGETVFKREGKYGASSFMLEDSLTTCEKHDFKYKPRAGDAVLFFSLHPDLTVDPRALHGACPVKGNLEKWVATKWLHDKPINDWEGESGR